MNALKLLIKKGTTSKRIAIFIKDSTQTDERGLAALAWDSAGLVWYYRREDAGDVGATSAVLATATRGTYTSGGFIEIDAANLPGYYEIGIPNAVLATGAGWVVMVLRGAANMMVVRIEIQLVDFDPNDGVRLGLTALPNAAADAAGGLAISDAGGLDLDTKLGYLTGDAYTRLGAPAGASVSADVAAVKAETASIQADTNDIQTRLPAALVGGRIDASVGAYPGNTAQTGDSYARLGAPAGASVSADVAAVKAETASIQADTNDLQTQIGAAGAGLTALGDARLANLDAAVTSRLAPTVPARTLDVSATGEAGVDWANVGSPTTVLNLSGTTVKTATDVETDTQNIQNRLPAALVDGRIDASIGAYPGNTAQTGDAYARLGAPAGASVSADVAAVKAETASIQADTNDLQTQIGAAGAGLTAVTQYIDTEVAAIKAKTDNLPAQPAAVGSAMTLTSGERDSVADALLDRANAIETGWTLRQALRIISSLAGKLSGAAGTVLAFRNLADTKTRITATVDGNGNRTAVAFDGD